jgi:hypothetical protein
MEKWASREPYKDQQERNDKGGRTTALIRYCSRNLRKKPAHLSASVISDVLLSPDGSISMIADEIRLHLATSRGFGEAALRIWSGAP